MLKRTPIDEGPGSRVVAHITETAPKPVVRPKATLSSWDQAAVAAAAVVKANELAESTDKPYDQTRDPGTAAGWAKVAQTRRSPFWN